MQKLRKIPLLVEATALIMLASSSQFSHATAIATKTRIAGIHIHIVRTLIVIVQIQAVQKLEPYPTQIRPP